MKNFKKLIILPLFLFVIFTGLFFSACKKDGSEPKTYSITFENNQTISGIFVYNIETPEVKEGEDATFYIGLQSGYDKGELKVLCNGSEMIETETEIKNALLYLYYTISNVTENKIISLTGTLERNKYSLSVIWNPYSSMEIEDKKLEDFFVDLTISSSSDGSSDDTILNLKAPGFKEFMSSDEFNIPFYYNDTVTISVYAKDDCESYVDGFIMYNVENLEPCLEKATETIKGTDVSYLKATYSFVVTSNSDIVFYESAIIKSTDIAKNYVEIDGIEANSNTPEIVMRNDDGEKITTYLELKNAKTVDVYIENVSNIWKPILANHALQYSLSNTGSKFVVEDGNYVFKNAGKPYEVSTLIKYTLTITNAKDLIMNSGDYSKIKILHKNIYSITTFADEVIHIDGEGNYYHTENENNIVFDIKNEYTKLEVNLSNTFGEYVTIIVPLNDYPQTINENYTFSKYINFSHYDSTTTQYVLHFDGKGTFYSSISITAIQEA